MIQRTVTSECTIDLDLLIEDHFDPKWGSPYWCDRRRDLGVDPLKEIQTVNDLARFGPFPEEHLRTFSAASFVPRKFHDRLHEFVYSETGGTTGKAKGVYFSPEEFGMGFVDPFLQVCRKIGWPMGEKQLFLGPSGPHIIGKVLDPICRALGSPPPFRIDFDPRWSLRLTDRSTARFRYLDHLVDQALHLIDKERPGILFGSPQVLQRLAGRMEEIRREEIRAVHYGGTSLDPEVYRIFREDLFPQAIHLSGYGNSLVGVAFEAGVRDGDRLNYYPSLDRHRIRLIPLGGAPIADRLSRNVGEGETGQVVVSRLDSTFFLPNLVERDQAEMIFAPGKVADLGWSPEGIHNPRPVLNNETLKGALY